MDARLTGKVPLKTGNRAAALAVGFIHPPSVRGRKQYIIVLTQAASVLCFDHRLRLVWETLLMEEHTPELYYR